MLQALLASGAMLSGIKAELADRAQRFAFMAVMGVIALLFLLVGLGALAAAAAIALEPRLGLAGAVAVVGGVAVLIAVVLVLIGTHRKTQRAVTQEAPASDPASAALGGLADSAAQAPVPWLIGALVLGMVLGRKG